LSLQIGGVAMLSIKRGKLQFRLVTLLGFVTVFCIVLGVRSWWAAAASSQRAVLARLQAQGPVDETYWEHSIPARLEIATSWLLGVKFRRVEGLMLHGDRFTADGHEVAQALQPFSELARLDVIDLESFDDDDLAGLPWLPNLRDITLLGTSVTDRSAETLVRCPRLASINLNDSEVTDRTLEILRDLPTLKFLMVFRSNVTPHGVAKFRMARPDVHFGAE